MPRHEAPIGGRFGKWTVVASEAKTGPSKWKCQCDCGSIAVVHANSLKRGKSRQCTGCAAVSLQVPVTHGMAGHGDRRPPEYRVWMGVKQRHRGQLDKTNYADRGITCCERWLSSFPNFLADMGHRPTPTHSIDRIDNDKGYTPDNCRWATRQEQLRNTRVNRKLTYTGESLPVVVWAERMGTYSGLLLSRLKMGWSVEKTLTTKPGGCNERTN